MRRLKTDCAVLDPDVRPAKLGYWDFSRWQGSLQDIVHQPIVDVIDTGCPNGGFQQLLVLRSGDLLTELAGNYYVFTRVR